MNDNPSQDRAADWPLDSVVAELRQVRHEWREQQGRERDLGSRELPALHAVHEVVDDLCGILFPMRLGPSDLSKESEDYYVGHRLGHALTMLHGQVKLELNYRLQGVSPADHDQEARGLVRAFALLLPELRRQLDQDVVAAYRGDPAATCVDEILLCYPGIFAVIHHRIASVFYRSGLPIIARIVSEKAHSVTGIDIHPGATIGRQFFIDHGTGVVIGETAVIGDRVRLYQAVTLGAVRFSEDDEGGLKKGEARHPVVEDDVVIYAGATVLGRITIGRGSIIGGNVWLTRSVPPGSNITQATLRQTR
ncbi:serine O-acetyltransferase EpsC [Halomonas sp. MA07-2]|uniref:serine O-acetyltransferase EpsC n=1 Tax=unclassified Halomonas TaxID=2609666 RepID=UPI003EEBE905